MGFQTDLVTGLAQLLAAQGVGTWRANGAYVAGETGILLRTLPQAPDRVISLAAYGVDDDPTLSDDTVGLQNLPRTTLATGVVVTKCYRRSWSSLGQDTNSRWRTSQNFYVTAHRPSQHRH
jgi:hypothetical protein